MEAEGAGLPRALDFRGHSETTHVSICELPDAEPSPRYPDPVFHPRPGRIPFQGDWAVNGEADSEEERPWDAG